MKKYGFGGVGGGSVTLQPPMDVNIDDTLFVERLADRFMTGQKTEKTTAGSSSGKKKAATASGGAAAAPSTASADLPTDAEVLEGYYNTLKSAYTPERIEYEQRGEDEIAQEIMGWLRPGYDKAIEKRQQQTSRYHAELDADAIARGMGASTFVTDVKERQKSSESSDIGAMEADYSASLAKYVSDAVEKESARALEVKLFNSAREHEVYLAAYEEALSMFALYKAKGGGAVSIGGGSSSGGSSKKSGESGGTNGAGKTVSSGTGGVGYEFDDVVATTPENCERFVAGLTVAERRKILLGETEQDKRYRAELIASVGEKRYWELIAGK